MRIEDTKFPNEDFPEVRQMDPARAREIRRRRLYEIEAQLADLRRELRGAPTNSDAALAIECRALLLERERDVLRRLLPDS